MPRESDLVFDVRFLANPYYQPDLKLLTGRDEEVARFIRDDQEYAPFLHSLTRLLRPLLPRYVAEGKSYLTIAIGCTGGRHRSVFVAEELVGWLLSQGQRVQVLHRDLDRSSGGARIWRRGHPEIMIGLVIVTSRAARRGINLGA